MNAIGWLLLLIVVGCIVALIVVSAKRKNSKEEEELITSTPEVPNATAPVQAEEISSQTTVYAYRSAFEVRLCAVCDGENNTADTHCRICGQQLK